SGSRARRRLPPRACGRPAAPTRRSVTGRRGPIDGSAPQGARTPEEVNAAVLAIHFPNKVSPRMRAAMRHRRVVEILTRLIGPDVKTMQSILFVKGAGQ